jgi:4-amino-4-deoxy-L-arabinose transferase-like glycosyltransferase
VKDHCTEANHHVTLSGGHQVSDTHRLQWLWRLVAAFLILASASCRLAYLARDCPLDLAPDEAHYWDWSRHLDWSYYSKGPLVAYLIRAGTELAGTWSRAHTGNEMAAVRLPAVLCGTLLLISLYVLTLQVYRRDGLATAVVALALTLPVVAAGSCLMTIDAPYTCCWSMALVLGYQAACRGLRWAWPLAGFIVGLGILAKYTMILFIPSLALFLLASRRRRSCLIRPGFWIMTGTAVLCCLPIVFWNANHNWVSLRHVGGQGGWQGEESSLRWQGPLAYVGQQFLLLLGFWFVAWLAAMIAYRPGKDGEPGVQYLWWMSAPMFVFFLMFSVGTKEQPNWPVTAYISGLVLTGAWLARQVRASAVWYRRLTAGGLALACLLGLLATGLVHHSEWAQPILTQWAGPASAKQTMPLRRIDPTCRLRGWRTLAAEVDGLRNRLRAEGVEAELAGGGWTIPGELGFYCQGHPVVYSFGLALGDRHSEYDLWRPNPLMDINEFRGKSFVFVGEISPDVLRAAFEAVEEPVVVTHYQEGEPVARWTVLVCRGYRGFGDVGEGLARERF